MVTSVMSFGSLTPIAVRVVGTDLKLVRQLAEKIAAEMKKIASLRDIQFEQTLDYPSVEVEIDREKAGLSGTKVDDVANALIMATASTRFSNLNYWIDQTTGFDYLVQLQIPPLRMEKPEDLETLPLESVNPLVNLMLRDVATVRRGVRPGELDRSMSQRYLTLTANVEGEDMGRASRSVARAIEAAGAPPRGVRVEPMGQLPPMTEMFMALGSGLGIAVFVILVLLTAYFQSPKMALISIGAVPGVIAGIATILYFTDTTLNIESFMGSIMCIGVSVSNSVMLVTFMNDHWKGGYTSIEAAIVGASDRLRPILMTACAMSVGMVPMALALERGSQMQAPLGRAVIGGLVMSTFATLLVLPSIFAMVVGRKEAKSPSIYPDDPQSKHYDPRVFLNEEPLARHDGPSHNGDESRRVDADEPVMVPQSEEEVLVFLKRILDEAKSHRSDMTTHYTVDDLLVALGFAKPKSEDRGAPGAPELDAALALAEEYNPTDDVGHKPGPGTEKPHPHGESR
jgi:multidrug efflux pump subunit AcrB